jgi:predicted outer membrane repeat protein
MNTSLNPSSIRDNSRRRLLPALLLSILCLLAVPCVAQTCDYTVNSLADSGTGSLRAGLADSTVANICFGVQGTITLNSPLQVVTPVTITANGAVTISGNNQVGIFVISPSSATDAIRINGFTLTNGNATAANNIYGGALWVQQGNVTLVGTSITNNTATSGGGIYNSGTLVLSGCGITNNTTTNGTGGGIYNGEGASLSLQGTAVSGNSAGTSGGGGLDNWGTAQIQGGTFSNNQGYQGGAILNESIGQLPISQGTTFSNNVASVDGGAIYNAGSTTTTQALFNGNQTQGVIDVVSCGGAFCNNGTATISESTFANNTTTGSGGAIENQGYYPGLTLNDVTIATNTASVLGSGLDIESYTTPTINNSIIAGNTAIPGSASSDCNGCTASNGAANLIGVTVNLGPLASNGGPNQTMMPLPGSSAIAAGAPTATTDTTDQRGFSRLSATGTIDVGAVQTHYSSVAFLAQPSNALVSQTITPAVAVQVVETDGATTNYPLGVPVMLTLLDSQSNPVSGVLTGTLTQYPTNNGGVIEAAFADLSGNTTGIYKLFATDAIAGNSSSANPAYSATSNTFDFLLPITLAWQPAPLTYGPMPQSELNATATINGTPATGTFVYTFVTPAAPINVGQIYPVGTYPVQVTFTPAGSTIPYTLTTTLQVNKATPVLTWPTPAAIYTSTPLSGTQLNATATGVTGAALPGTFVYNPVAGATLTAGPQVLNTTFTPSDTTNYTTAIARVTIQVNAVTAATVALQVSTNPITFGQTETLTATVVGNDGQPFSGGTASFTSDGNAIGSATVANGSASESVSSLTAGTHQIGVSYTNGSQAQPLSASAPLTVTKATPVLTWATPAPIFTVTPLSSTELDATAAGVNGASLPGTFVYSPAAGTLLPAGSQTLSTTFTPTDAVDYNNATAQVTIQVGYARIAITSVSPGTAPLGTTPLPITITGTGFTSTAVLEINGTAVATTVMSSTALSATIPAANLAKAATLSLSVYDPASKFVSNVYQFVVTAPPPDITFSIPPTTGSGEQPTVTIGLNSPYPSDLQGTLTLTFAPSGSNGIDDQAIQFSTGGRTLAFTVPAGSTTTPQVALQTGTVAGTITVTLTFTAGGVDVTPAGLMPITLVIAASAPVITRVTFTNNDQGQITVTVSGFSNTREVSQAEFVFSGSGADKLRSSKVDVPVTGLFGPWYSSSASDQFGSEFTYTQNFQLSKPDAGVTGVAVTLANSAGTSGSVNSQ